jgi:hypothetical protein
MGISLPNNHGTLVFSLSVNAQKEEVIALSLPPFRIFLYRLMNSYKRMEFLRSDLQ